MVFCYPLHTNWIRPHIPSKGLFYDGPMAKTWRTVGIAFVVGPPLELLLLEGTFESVAEGYRDFIRLSLGLAGAYFSET